MKNMKANAVPDFVADLSYLKQIDDQWNDLIPHIMDYNNTVLANQRDAVSKKIREFYFKSAPVTKATYPILIKVHMCIQKNRRRHFKNSTLF